MSPKDKIINEYIQIIEDAVLSWGYQKNSILFSEKVNITKRWLTNFKVSEINSMVTLLEKIQYKSEYIIKELIKIASQEIIAIFGEELKNVLFFPLGNSTASSGSMYLYNYRKELKLSEDNFKFENYKEYLNKDINIVFLDDMIGSGNQAIKFYKNNLINSNSKCYYISLFGYEDGVEKIRKEAKFEKVFACENITNEEMVFSSNSYVYPNEEERKNIRLICEEYGNKLYKNNPLGYDDSQSLLVFSHNTPNNTLPIIWASTENEKIIGELCWYPLFERKKITNRSSKNPITYMGTIKIDNGFISKIKQKNFKPFEFYTSKLTNNCQWYGILHNWDIKRVIQDEVKIQIIESFSKNIESKVISIIYGSGGSGKSTFLRRIAIDLANNIDFDVFWLTDIDDFYNSLLNSSFNKEKKSLIIIEDWYRFSDISNDLSKLLKTLLKFENIRIIIGDRDIENKDYIKYLYNPNLNMYHLNPKENDTLLKEIIKKVPIWQEIFGIVSKVQNYSSTSLYLILFILAKTSDEKYRNDTIDINDLINHYRIIIQSDIKLIAKENIGIASALIYWATLYKNNKILISDKDFLYLADFFNNNTDCSSYVNISDNSEISKMLHGYIYLEKTSFKIINNLNQLFFNHDILAEEGLSYATVEPLRINKIIDFKILDFAIEKFSDRTKSLLLTRRLQEKLFFRDDSHKLEYIEKLYKNNCNHYNYLRYLFNNQAYKKLHSKYASEVLEKSKQEILPSYMINICLNIVKNSEDGKKYALELLEKNTTKTIDPQIVTTCLNIVKNSEDGKKYALELLKKNTIKYIGFQLLSTSLNIVKKSKYGKEYALKLLKKNRNNDLDKEVISSCLNILVDSDEGKQYAIELLEKNRKENLAYQIVSSCLNILVDSDEGKQYAIELLEKSNYKNLHWGIVWQSLRIYAQFKIETNIINQIISNYNRKPSTDAEFNNYLQILKIPFFHNDEWLHEVNMRTKKWRVENRRFITSILIAYEYYPNESIQICNDILDNWKWEVNYQYKQHGIVELWKHIEISINHISLEKKAKEKAFEIISYDSAEPNIIPKILLDSCINIIDTPKG